MKAKLIEEQKDGMRIYFIEVVPDDFMERLAIEAVSRLSKDQVEVDVMGLGKFVRFGSAQDKVQRDEENAAKL